MKRNMICILAVGLCLSITACGTTGTLPEESWISEDMSDVSVMSDGSQTTPQQSTNTEQTTTTTGKPSTTIVTKAEPTTQSTPTKSTTTTINKTTTTAAKPTTTTPAKSITTTTTKTTTTVTKPTTTTPAKSTTTTTTKTTTTAAKPTTTTQNKSEKKSIMDYERVVSGTANIQPLSAADVKKMSIEKPAGVVIRVKVTEEYEAVNKYKMDYDFEHQLKGYEGYDQLEKTVEGWAIAEAHDDYFSYMLTTVSVEEVYFSGSEVNIKNGDLIQIREFCNLRSTSYFLMAEDTGEKALFFPVGGPKMEPGKEYIIFGFQSAYAEYYYFAGHHEGLFEVDESKDASYYSYSNRDTIFYDCLQSVDQ